MYRPRFSVFLCGGEEKRKKRSGHVKQGGGTPLQSVLRAATAVKIKVNGQLEIFSIVNSQATISL